MYCWIQITDVEAVRLEETGKIKPNSGYWHNQPLTGLPMREFHVDTCDLFQERMKQDKTLEEDQALEEIKPKNDS